MSGPYKLQTGGQLGMNNALGGPYICMPVAARLVAGLFYFGMAFPIDMLEIFCSKCSAAVSQLLHKFSFYATWILLVAEVFFWQQVYFSLLLKIINFQQIKILHFL